MTGALLDRLPLAWRRRLTDGRLERPRRGDTEAEVYRLVDRHGASRYLKVAVGTEMPALRAEGRKLAWLQARHAPVPLLLDRLDEPDLIALWTQGLAGTSAADAPMAPDEIVAAAAKTLRRFHAVSVQAWPFGSADDARLAAARARVAAGSVSSRDFDDEHRGMTPDALLECLMAWRESLPPVAVTMTHGDADLANLILDRDGAAGFVDCGDAGPADAYLDLFVMTDDIDARFGEDAVARFFQAYGIGAPDEERLAYYRLLDEFF